MITMIMNIVMTFFFFQNMNPLPLGLILIMQTLMASLFLGAMTKTFWIMYLLILTFVGGMLVLFIYVTSIFPNEKFYLNQKSVIMFLSSLLVIVFLINMYMYLFNLNMIFLDQIFYMPLSNMTIKYTTKMFFSSSPLLIFLVMYLFFCMLVVIKISNFKSGPLRKMN